MFFPDETRGGAINSALRLLGVDRSDDCDEFDVLGLGQFRCEDDLRTLACENIAQSSDQVDHVLLEGDDHKELVNTLEDLSKWRSVMYGKAELPQSTYYTNTFVEEMEKLADKALQIAKKGAKQ